MEIRERIYEIISEYDGTGQIDDCKDEIETLMMSDNNIKQFYIWTDTDVFDSCGLDIYYVSVSWIDSDGELDMCGDRLTSR